MNTRHNGCLAGAVHASSDKTGMPAETRSVLRNVYLLLSACLGFSALTAAAAITLKLPHPGLLLTMVGYYGLLFMVMRNRNRSTGVAWTFALTGFMGYTLGPIVGLYLKLPNGGMTVMMALGGTAATFFVMSAYALVTKRDLSFMGGILMTGILVSFIAGLAAIFLHLPSLSLAVSGMFVLLMSGMILYETNRIVRGGETNYIVATVGLFVLIFNLFTGLLHILGFINSAE